MIARGCILMDREEVAVVAAAEAPSPAAVADVDGSTSIVCTSCCTVARSLCSLPAQNYSRPQYIQPKIKNQLVDDESKLLNSRW